VTKSKFVPVNYKVPELPDSTYRPAEMDVRSIEAGIVKYFNPILHHSYFQILVDLITKLQLPTSVDNLQKKINKAFDAHFEALHIFLEDPLPADVVLELATHSLSGALRSATSAGIGFSKDRKSIAREDVDDFLRCYGCDDFSIEIFWKIFLKDELREGGKKTRSIAVGQLHMWIYAMKYLGGLYFFMRDTKPAWAGFGMTDRIDDWTEKFQDWNENAETYGFDIKGQDSKMSPGFVEFIELFLKRHSPVEHWKGIEWVLDQSFTSKKVVDYMGRILQFSQGEMSGFPLTILMNTFHNLFIHVCHEVAMEFINGVKDESKLKVIVGDDTIMQTVDPELFIQVAKIIGHDTTTEKGTLFNGVTFLSMKLRKVGTNIACYYANLDKMYASLVYTTGGTDEYFQKLCSFINLLTFAPKGSIEHTWLQNINIHAQYLLTLGEVSKGIAGAYKPIYLVKRSRYGYQ